MNATINTLAELVGNLESTINNVENEIEINNKFNKFVILYIPTKPNDLFYGLTEKDVNQVSSNANGIKNIIPTPNPKTIKLMDYSNAINEYRRLRSIQNGKGETYIAEVVQYKDYVGRFLKEMKKSYELIKDML